MKPEEALENLKVAVNVYHESGDHWNESDNEMDEALKIAIQALEKRVPKLAIWEGPYNDAKDDAEAYCPNNECNYELDDDDWSFCPKCGTSVVFHQDEVQK